MIVIELNPLHASTSYPCFHHDSVLNVLKPMISIYLSKIKCSVL